ncbi:collagen alpha-1(I) chain-like [Antechinus flavipes]|uniref:collagen alpha-1(I) chain-like n=1 Tax=Antechinus flavipes TaxID=38775 RepID=UPI002235C72F|nr:collagen alpha-1(I) chain-like [Antechinus flavipes]
MGRAGREQGLGRAASSWGRRPASVPPPGPAGLLCPCADRWGPISRRPRGRGRALEGQPRSPLQRAWGGTADPRSVSGTPAAGCPGSAGPRAGPFPRKRTAPAGQPGTGPRLRATGNQRDSASLGRLDLGDGPGKPFGPLGCGQRGSPVCLGSGPNWAWALGLCQGKPERPEDRLWAVGEHGRRATGAAPWPGSGPRARFSQPLARPLESSGTGLGPGNALNSGGAAGRSETASTWPGLPSPQDPSSRPLLGGGQDAPALDLRWAVSRSPWRRRRRRLHKPQEHGRCFQEQLARCFGPGSWGLRGIGAARTRAPACGCKICLSAHFPPPGPALLWGCLLAKAAFWGPFFWPGRRCPAARAGRSACRPSSLLTVGPSDVHRTRGCCGPDWASRGPRGLGGPQSATDSGMPRRPAHGGLRGPRPAGSAFGTPGRPACRLGLRDSGTPDLPARPSGLWALRAAGSRPQSCPDVAEAANAAVPGPDLPPKRVRGPKSLAAARDGKPGAKGASEGLLLAGGGGLPAFPPQARPACSAPAQIGGAPFRAGHEGGAGLWKGSRAAHCKGPGAGRQILGRSAGRLLRAARGQRGPVLALSRANGPPLLGSLAPALVSGPRATSETQPALEGLTSGTGQGSLSGPWAAGSAVVLSAWGVVQIGPGP